MMATLGAVLLLRTSFSSRRCPEVVLRWSGVTLSAPTTASLRLSAAWSSGVSTAVV
jgi:hypothetical protein